MNRLSLILLISIFISGILSGCISTKTKLIIDSPENYQQQLSQLHHWTIKGKIAIKQKKQSNNAAIRWQQTEDKFNLFVSGPIGLGATKISGNSKQFSITNSSDNKNIDIDKPEAALKHHLGWTLPLKNLPQWVTAHIGNIKEVRHIQFNADHTVASFHQDNWRVSYPRYQLQQNWLLPEKIILQKQDTRIMIIIKSWEIH